MEAENQSIGQTPQPTMKQPVGKNKNLLLIIILAVLAVGGIGFGGFELWQNMQKDEKNTNLEARFKDNEAIDTENEDTDIFMNGDAEVKTLIEEISGVVDDYSGHSDSVKTFNEFMPRWRIPDANITTRTEKSYGVEYGKRTGNGEIEDKLSSTYIIVEEYLEKNGYNRFEDSHISLFPVLYYNEQKHIVCEVTEGFAPWSIGCAKTDWISDGRRQLAIELAEASDIDYLIPNPEAITDSDISPYQRISVGGQGVFFFYRTDPAAQWQFIGGTHDFINCERFNEDAKKAYAGAGVRCWDPSTNSLQTL